MSNSYNLAFRNKKKTPFVVVDSLKIYGNLHDLGWYGRRPYGDFPTVLLCEHARIENFAGGGGGGSGPTASTQL